MTIRNLALLAAVIFVAGCASKKLAGRASQQAPAAQRTEPAAPAAQELVQSRPVDESKPVRVTADRLTYDDKRKETRFDGRVTVRQDSATLYADRVVTKNQKETGHAEGHVRLVDTLRKIEMTAGRLEYANKLSVADVTGGLHLVTDDPYGRSVTVTSKTGRVWPRAGQARLAGDVRAYRGNITATAAAAEVDHEAGKVVLKESVTVRMDDNRFTSQKATFLREGNNLVLEDDVRARFIPAELEQAADPGGDEP